MWEDPIVEEVHAVRAQLLERFGGDFHKYCEYVRSLPAPSTAAYKPPLQNAEEPKPGTDLKAGGAGD